MGVLSLPNQRSRRHTPTQPVARYNTQFINTLQKVLQWQMLTAFPIHSFTRSFSFLCSRVTLQWNTTLQRESCCLWGSAQPSHLGLPRSKGKRFPQRFFVIPLWKECVFSTSSKCSELLGEEILQFLPPEQIKLSPAKYIRVVSRQSKPD